MSFYKKVELNFNTLYEILENHKNVFLKKFETNAETLMKELVEKEQNLDQSISFYENIIQNVRDLKQNSEDLG